MDEDPHQWEVSLVKIAASAPNQDEGMRAVHEVLARLDETTVFKVLVLLASDFAWSSKESGPAAARDWAELRKFHLLAARYGDGE